MKFRFALAFTLLAFPAFAADYPAPKEGDWVAKDFKFHTGEVMQQVKLHYTTIGDPSNPVIVVLHGSGGSAKSQLGPTFAGVLFGKGQPFDAEKLPASSAPGSLTSWHVDVPPAIDPAASCVLRETSSPLLSASTWPSDGNFPVHAPTSL